MTMVEINVYEYLSKKELIIEMRNDEAMRGQHIDTNLRKINLVQQWVRDGDIYGSKLYCGSVSRGSRRPEDDTSVWLVRPKN